MKYIGIDYGSKRVGVALSDEAGTMGFPRAILKNTPQLTDELCTIITQEKVGGIVIGESRDFFGRANPIAKEAYALGEALTAQTGIEVVYEPEVLTSEEARQAPHKLEKTRVPRATRHIDDSAAAIILTSYLSKQHD